MLVQVRSLQKENGLRKLGFFYKIAFVKRDVGYLLQTNFLSPNPEFMPSLICLEIRFYIFLSGLFVSNRINSTFCNCDFTKSLIYRAF